MSDLESKIPPEIPEGEKGWKKRQLERAIMESMFAATQPHSGWSMFQKLRKKLSSVPDGDDMSLVMQSLVQRGYLKKVGIESGCGFLFDLERENQTSSGQ